MDMYYYYCSIYVLLVVYYSYQFQYIICIMNMMPYFGHHVLEVLLVNIATQKILLQ